MSLLCTDRFEGPCSRGATGRACASCASDCGGSGSQNLLLS